MTKSIRSRPIETLLAGFLMALPIVLFALVWNYYAVDIPKWDDHALRDFLVHSGEESSLSGKIYFLVRQHNEHRIVYDRIVTALDYGLFGELNYRHLMVVGNLSLIGLLVLLGQVLRQFKPVQHRLLYLVPVAFMLFNLSQWENMFWGMAALQNFTVVLWVLWSIYLVAIGENRPAYLYGAIMTGILATLTSGNGMLIWPIGFGILLLQQQWHSLQRWSISAVIVLILYFVGYEKPAGNPPNRGSFLDLLTGWLAFNGSAGEAWPVGSGFQNSLMVGSLLTVVALVALFFALRPLLTRFTRALRSTSLGAGRSSVQSPKTRITFPATYFFIGSVIFLLGTGALVAWTRVGFGLDLLITSRYKLYSLTLLAVVYIYLIGTLPNRAGRWVGVLGGVGGLALAWLSYYSFLDETIWWRHYQLTNQFNWTYTTSHPVARIDPVSARYSQPAAAFYDPILPRLYGAAQQPAQSLTIEETDAAFTVRELSGKPTDLRDGRSYVVARSEGPQGRTYLFPVWQSMRSAKAARLLPWKSFQPGFVATLPKRDLAAGTYNLLVLSATPDGGWALYPTYQTVRSVGQSGVDIQKNW